MPSKNTRPWFKAYTETILDDPRLGQLPAEYFRVYVQLYALCARHGIDSMMPGDARDLGWRLGYPTESTQLALDALESAGFISQTPTGVILSEWDWQQPEYSDAERQRRARDRKVAKTQDIQ